MEKKIKAFAYLGEKLQHEVQVDLPLQVSKAIILDKLQKQFPQFKQEIDECSVAINQGFAGEEIYSVTEIDEIALIPPVSGG
ncbi:MAG TPA: MoaD/ThiS family protein [Tetragenococcus sp.]|nr:MoaD/ThiS family protein [Tetragenococcus sp.]